MLILTCEAFAASTRGGSCMHGDLQGGEVGVTGQRGTVICRSGDRLALQSAGQLGPQNEGCHQAGATADVGYAVAGAVPEREAGAPDVALLVRRAAEGDHWAWERLVD